MAAAAQAPKPKGGAAVKKEIAPEYNGLHHSDNSFGAWSVHHGRYSRWLPKREDFMPKAQNQFDSYRGFFARHKGKPDVVVCCVREGKKCCEAELKYAGAESNSNLVAHIAVSHPHLLMYEEVAARGLHPIDLTVPVANNSSQARLVSSTQRDPRATCQARALVSYMLMCDNIPLRTRARLPCCRRPRQLHRRQVRRRRRRRRPRPAPSTSSP
jgi:hypothetical protein